MKLVAAFFTLLLVGSLAFASAANAPVLPEKNRADILQIQKQMAEDQVAYMQLQSRLQELQTDFQKENLALTQAQKDACDAAKANCETDWSLDLNSLKFVPKPKAAKK